LKDEVKDLLQKYFLATDLHRFSLILKNSRKSVKSVAERIARSIRITTYARIPMNKSWKILKAESPNTKEEKLRAKMGIKKRTRARVLEQDQAHPE